VKTSDSGGCRSGTELEEGKERVGGDGEVKICFVRIMGGVLGGKWLHAGAKPIFGKNYKKKISGKRVCH